VLDRLIAGRITDDSDQIAGTFAGSFEAGSGRARIAHTISDLRSNPIVDSNQHQEQQAQGCSGKQCVTGDASHSSTSLDPKHGSSIAIAIVIPNAYDESTRGQAFQLAAFVKDSSGIFRLVSRDSFDQVAPNRTKFARGVTNVDTIESHADRPTNVSQRDCLWR
jgi:hypothetical protein